MSNKLQHNLFLWLFLFSNLQCFFLKRWRMWGKYAFVSKVTFITCILIFFKEISHFVKFVNWSNSIITYLLGRSILFLWNHSFSRMCILHVFFEPTYKICSPLITWWAGYLRRLDQISKRNTKFSIFCLMIGTYVLGWKKKKISIGHQTNFFASRSSLWGGGWGTNFGSLQMMHFIQVFCKYLA